MVAGRQLARTAVTDTLLARCPACCASDPAPARHAAAGPAQLSE